MGLAGYVDRDRENNKIMSENIMSEYGVSFWEKSTKPYISNVDDCGDDEDEIENQEVSMYMYNEFPFPIEYKRDFVKIIDDIIGEYESEIMEINKLIDERKSKLDLLQSEDKKERFDSLCIWARYGNMKGKGRPSIV